MIKWLLLLNLICLKLVCQAQISAPEVAISGSKTKLQQLTSNLQIRPLIGSKAIDSADIENFRQLPLDQLLSTRTNTIINNYGFGNLATLNLRGLGAGHSAVFWNRLSLNTAALGQADLSAVPVSFFDNAQVINGSGALVYAGGSFGGVLNLTTQPQQIQKGYFSNISSTLNALAGSFGLRSYGVKVSMLDSNQQWCFRGYNSFANNNFTYDNLTKPSNQQSINTNATQQSNGVLVDYFRHCAGSNILQSSIWLQQKQLGLAPSMFQDNSQQSQNTKALYASIIYGIGERQVGFGYLVQTGLTTERLDYHYPEASINSQNNSTTAQIQTELNYNFKNKINTAIVSTINTEFVAASTNNYNRLKTQNSVIVGWEPIEMLNLKAVYKLESAGNKNFILPAFNLELEPFKFRHQKLIFAAMANRIAKFPTLNDLYWQPTGNINLLAEIGFNTDANLKHALDFGSNTILKSSVSVYNTVVDNWIAWVPSFNGQFRPINVAKVKATGMDISTEVIHKEGNMSGSLKLLYNRASVEQMAIYASESNGNIGQQLIYTPKQSGKVIATVSVSKLTITYEGIGTGIRYITSNNADYLPAYYLQNVAVSLENSFSRYFLKVGLRVNNITSYNYQTIAYRAMPGINFTSNITLRF